MCLDFADPARGTTNKWVCDKGDTTCRLCLSLLLLFARQLLSDVLGRTCSWVVLVGTFRQHVLKDLSWSYMIYDFSGKARYRKTSVCAASP